MNRAFTTSALAALLVLAISAPAVGAPPPRTRNQLICKADSGHGFSYWWGGGAWCANGCSPNYGCGKGKCTPQPGYAGCPHCTHSGSTGADCSGYVGRIWDVPYEKAININWHPYGTWHFYNNATHWDHIDKGAIAKGDALVYNNGSAGHIILYNSGDPWGYSNIHHSKGCAYYITQENKYVESKYKARRRHNIVVGECDPGQTQSQACGNCGSKTRTCSSNGSWGGWSSCNGQGPCAPGQGQSEVCGDCGSRSRSCGGDCHWGGWSGCDGPDPDGGNQVCDSGLPGLCAEGRMRCQAGWLSCVQLLFPQPELCDDLDNDCDGVLDNGQPQEMGQPPPALAAALVDLSYPKALSAGSEALAWVDFRNVGGQAWQPGDLWLTFNDEQVSPFFVPGGWPAWDTPAVLEHRVAPGETARFVFPLRAPPESGLVFSDTLILRRPAGEALRCPAPGLQVKLRTLPFVSESPLPQTDESGQDAEESLDTIEPQQVDTAPDAESNGAAGTGCSAAMSGTPASALMLLLLLLSGFVCRSARRRTAKESTQP